MKAKHRAPKLIPELEPMDTRVVPSVVGFGQRFHARAALAQQNLRQSGAISAFRFTSPGNTRLNAPTLQSSNTTLFGRRVAFPTTFGNTPPSRQAAMFNLAKPSVQQPLSMFISSNSLKATASSQAAATTEIGDVKNGALAKAGQDLLAIYQALGPSGSGQAPTGGAASIEVVGSSVGVSVRTSGDVNALAAKMTSAGMQIRGTDPNTHIVSGLLPIAQLPNVAQLSEVTSIIPIYRPMHR